MKVLVRMEGMSPGRHGGIENFIYSLVRGISRACPDIDVVLAVSGEEAARFARVLSDVAVDYREIAQAADWIAEQVRSTWARRLLGTFSRTRLGARFIDWRLRRRLARVLEDVDVVLYPSWKLPLELSGKPAVMVVHDLRWFERDDTGPALRQMLLQAPPAAIITGWPGPYAVFTRLFPELRARGFMIPFVMDPAPGVPVPGDRMRSRSLLYTSSNGAEKNHETLIRALGLLKRSGATPVRVFCTGPLVAERSVTLERLVEAEGVGDWIFFLGWVPRPFVLWLYQFVDGVISTTLYEAMSGTVMEGWQHGQPVACSKIPSIEAMTDLLGVDVRFFNPLDPADVAAGITDLIEHPEPYRRGAMKAREILHGLSQDETARQYCDVLAWACGQSKRPPWHPYRAWWKRDDSASSRIAGTAEPASTSNPDAPARATQHPQGER